MLGWEFPKVKIPECLEKSHCAHTLAHHRGKFVKVYKLCYILNKTKIYWLGVILFLEHQIATEGCLARVGRQLESLLEDKCRLHTAVR